MKTPTINSRILKLEVLKGTATRTSVNAVESRTTSLESDISTLQTDVSAAEGNISTLQGDVATLTQGIQDAVSTHNAAPDSHSDIRTLVADRALIGHQHARTDLPWVTDSGAALLTAASASAQRTALGMTAWAVAPWTDGTTSDIPEGTQLYFTNARADARAALIVSTHNTATDSHADIRTLVAGKQAAGSYLTTTGTAADSSKLGGVAASGYALASDAVSKSATGLGVVGNYGGDAATTTAAAWSALPVGYSRLMHSSIGAAGGLPTNSMSYYFTKLANRDGNGGWAGLAVAYTGLSPYLGTALTSADFASWSKIHTDNSTPSLTNIEALPGTSGLLRKTAANTWSLDTKNYAETEQGTWTPRITNGAKASGSDADATYVAAKYVRNGNLVTVTLGCVFANKVEYSGSDIKQIYIYGIPFVMSGGPSGMAWMANTYGTCVLGGAPINGYVVAGSSYVAIGTGSSWPLLVNGQSIYFTITYVKA